MITRRKLILGLAGIGVAGAAGYGVHSAREFEIESVPMRPPKWEGGPFTIVFLADIHRGPYVSMDYLFKVAQAASGLDPDLVLFGGDYVYASKKYFEEAFEPFARLDPPAGKWGILGNHDHYNGRKAALEAMKKYRVEDLTNESAKLWINRNPLWLFGIDDYRTGHPDPVRAVKAVPKGGLCIGMTHNPDLYLKMPLSLEPPLLLAGHTHGGQMRLPFIGAPFLYPGHGKAFEEGEKRVGRSRVHVSRGIGTIALPMRFNCPAEITVVRISSPDKEKRK
jgi:hypothetical protein